MAREPSLEFLLFLLVFCSLTLTPGTDFRDTGRRVDGIALRGFRSIARKRAKR